MGLGGDTAQYGYNSWVGIIEETTYGTRDTVAAYMEFNSESLKQNRETLVLESINTTRDPMRYFQGNETVEGALEFDLNPASDIQVYILKQAMGGTVTSDSTTATDFKHTINPGGMENNKSTSGAADTKALSISVQKGSTTTAQWHFSGCRVNNLTISGEMGQPVKCTADIIGKTATNTTETHTIAFDAIKPIHFVGVSITTGGTTTSLSATCVIGFEFSLANNLISDNNARCLGDRTLKILPPNNREVKLKMTMRFNTTTAYNSFIEQTSTSVNILLDTLQSLTAAGGSTYSMYIEIPKLYYDSNPMPVIGEKGIITTDLEFVAVKANTITGNIVTMQVNNATSSY